MLLFFYYYSKKPDYNSKPIIPPIIKSKPKPKHKPKSKPILKPVLKPAIKPKTNIVFLDISINNKLLGKIVIELFTDIVPRTCENFKQLCTNKNNLSYKNSPFHRIINDFMIQGGDFTNGNGTGGKSIYGHKFNDENFILKHSEPYMLSMANSGPNSNGSQFFITTASTPHLDDKHVVFGKIIKGFKYIDILNNVKTTINDKPVDKIIISDCGLYNKN